MDDNYLFLILSSAVGVAIVTTIKELLIWVLNRRAKKADDKDDYESKLEEFKEVIETQQKSINTMIETINALQSKLDLYLDDYKLILKDKIKYLVDKYLEYGEITLEQKQAIIHMWNVYHYDLKGNGDLDDWMSLLESISIKRGQS